jgi:hypothetical protein
MQFNTSLPPNNFSKKTSRKFEKLKYPKDMVVVFGRILFIGNLDQNGLITGPRKEVKVL